ncbi:hypothetical protein [Devosia submarina]|uniref:hypothetical protein n=1 Tax=Devosia submarina TaxID=1173082 RepID=UPI000D3972BF|nr:hypothetical protein [Devosia submarina]
MPNSFAYVMLSIWPLVVVALFRRLPLERAFIWTILGGYLFLPPVAYLDVPLFPPLTKHAIPALCALVAIWMHQGHMPRLLPHSMLARLALTVFMFSGVGTVLTNTDPQITGVVYLQPMAMIEVIIGIISQFLVILPMLLAQDILRRPEHIREVMLALVIAGLLYSVPMLIEVRLSPQINVWIYGFFQHSFQQMIRYGGFRPIVFLEHGLWVALFAFMAVGSAFTMLRKEATRRAAYLAMALYLALVLALCKSAGSLLLAACFVPLVLFVGQRMQIRIAAILALIVISYPMLRGGGFIPTETILSQTTATDVDRAQSLEFRLVNEDMLLDRAAERPVFGWGGWGRNHLHDPVTGRTLTTVDGLWIGAIGSSGWAGYLGLFGLLTLPLFLLAKQAGSLDLGRAVYVAPLALLLSFNLVDLIPNATLTPVSWLIVGALLGYAGKQEYTAKTVLDIERPAQPAPWARERPSVA